MKKFIYGCSMVVGISCMVIQLILAIKDGLTDSHVLRFMFGYILCDSSTRK